MARGDERVGQDDEQPIRVNNAPLVIFVVVAAVLVVLSLVFHTQMVSSLLPVTMTMMLPTQSWVSYHLHRRAMLMMTTRRGAAARSVVVVQEYRPRCRFCFHCRQCHCSKERRKD